MAPRAASANDLGLVQPEDRFRERIVVAVADAPDRGLDAGLGQPLRIADRQVLHASVTVVNQRLTWSHSAVMQCLLTRIQREVGAQRVLHHRGSLERGGPGQTQQSGFCGAIGSVGRYADGRGG